MAPAGLAATVLSRSWGDGGEAAFGIRALAGGLSRLGPVQVLVPGPAGEVRADGLFDPTAVGTDGAGGWPDPDRARWPGPAAGVVLCEGGDGAAVALARHRAGAATVLAVAGDGAATGGADGAVVVGPGEGSVGLYVPVHPLAAERRHNGLGFDRYVLVLSGRPGPAGAGPDGGGDPVAAVAWLAAGRPRHHLVVVEGGAAAVYLGRALRGVVAVDSRTDLWRLMAHASVTVDLRPGPLVARECVESLRFGTPVVVPAGTVAARLAGLGGGLPYGDAAGLLSAVEILGEPGRSGTVGDRGRSVADDLYGDPDRFVGRLQAALGALVSAGSR